MVFLIHGLAVPASAKEVEVPSTLVEQSRDAAKKLQQALGKALLDAMQKKGVNGAVETCHLLALPITRDIANQLGADIGRTALRVRNPQNQPDAWEREQLEQFVERLDKGESIAGLEASSYDGKRLRYMKAIPMQAPCVACHGRQVDPELHQRIRALYPQDQAMGFDVGDLRGAFTVTITTTKEK